jgi:hypothetical protein
MNSSVAISAGHMDVISRTACHVLRQGGRHRQQVIGLARQEATALEGTTPAAVRLVTNDKVSSGRIKGTGAIASALSDGASCGSVMQSRIVAGTENQEATGRWVQLVEQGKSCAQVCLECGISRPTPRKWVDRYRAAVGRHDRR